MNEFTSFPNYQVPLRVFEVLRFTTKVSFDRKSKLVLMVNLIALKLQNFKFIVKYVNFCKTCINE